MCEAVNAPFKLAITGTPMENNLLELWSLLAITAPGLFPSPTTFTDVYRIPSKKKATQSDWRNFGGASNR